MMNRLRLIPAWCVPAMVMVAVSGTGWSQGNDQAKARGWLRVLPVGDAPPFRQEIVNGVRRELAAPDGALPPREVVLPLSKDKDESVEALRLRLGTISAPNLVSAGPLVVSGKDAGQDAKPWTRLVMPERSAALAVVFRDPKERTWDAVLSIVMADDLAAFPIGSVRFANATPFLVSVAFQGKTSELKPGQVLVVRGDNGGLIKEAPLVVAGRDSRGRVKRIFDSAISQAAGERTNAVIHWSDGERPRRPAKVLLLRERPALRKVPKA